MSSYVLYGGEFTRTLITQMVMAEGGIDYELRQVDIIRHEHKSSEFLSINPAGLVPALVTPEGDVLYETPAINLYLADRHQLHQVAPAISDPDRGKFLSALFYLTSELEPAMKRYFYPHRYAPLKADSEKIKHKAFEDAMARFSVIDRRLSAEGPFHLGDRFSLADLTLAYWVGNVETEAVFNTFPAIGTCVHHAISRPAIRSMGGEVGTLRDRYRTLQSRGGGIP
jgi:glutathione S-transferase